jgi:hypothetical protein
VEPDLSRTQRKTIADAVDELGHPDPEGAKERLGFLILILNNRPPRYTPDPARGRQQLKRLSELATEASKLLTNLEQTALLTLRSGIGPDDLNGFAARCIEAVNKLPRRANALTEGNGPLALAAACAEIYSEANPRWRNSLTSDLQEFVREVFTALTGDEDNTQGLHALRVHLKRTPLNKR